MRARHPHGEVDEGGGTDRDQHGRAQPGGTLPVLALGPDQRAEDEGRREADHGIEEGVEFEGLNEAQSSAPAKSAGYSWRRMTEQ